MNYTELIDIKEREMISLENDFDQARSMHEKATLRNEMKALYKQLESLKRKAQKCKQK